MALRKDRTVRDTDEGSRTSLRKFYSRSKFFYCEIGCAEKQLCSDFRLPADNKGQVDNLGYTLF